MVFVLRSFIKLNKAPTKFNKAPTKFNEALTKPYHDSIEILP